MTSYCLWLCVNVFVFFNIQEINQREQEGQLDEGFLAEVNAQLRQVSLFGLILMPSSLFWYKFTLGLCLLTLPFGLMHILFYCLSLSLSLSHVCELLKLLGQLETHTR